jgi:hypothetical protein
MCDPFAELFAVHYVGVQQEFTLLLFREVWFTALATLIGCLS